MLHLLLLQSILYFDYGLHSILLATLVIWASFLNNNIYLILVLYCAAKLFRNERR